MKYTCLNGQDQTQKYNQGDLVQPLHKVRLRKTLPISNAGLGRGAGAKNLKRRPLGWILYLLWDRAHCTCVSLA